jgi:hypothetical protein
VRSTAQSSGHERPVLRRGTRSRRLLPALPTVSLPISSSYVFFSLQSPQDDGEFDDPYINPPPASSSPAMKPQRRNKEAPAAQPTTPGGRLSGRSPAASSSAISRSYRAGSEASNSTDLAASGTRRRKHGKPRRKGSQELFDVHWESDVKVASCGLCSSDFSLVRRKHHCRHCGRVMCSDCSAFLYFEFSHRKHRVCNTCNNQLLAEQQAFDRETLAGGSQDRDANLFDDSSDDGRPSAVDLTPASSTSGEVQRNNLRSTLSALTPKHNGEDDKTRKKQEKKERKERRKREKMEKKGKAKQGTTTAAPVPKQAVIENLPSNGTALFDGADDDWFADVPDQHARSRDSGDEFSDDGGSKGPGWRDRVKDTYSVTAASERPPVLAPLAGGTLTAGITGKGYISDQFRYDDVGGPGLGHDDDVSVAMPRPKQQTGSVSYTDQSVKPSGLTGDGYFSEQFTYDDVGGPGLGHDDDRTVAMPRPKQQLAATPYSYESVTERNSGHDIAPVEDDFQPRLTFKDNLKDMFNPTKRRQSTATKRERKAKASKPRARGDQNMTLDELNPSYSSEEEPQIAGPAMPRPPLTSAQPAFYDKDADKRVVDDSPGFFEATVVERQAQRKKEEQQQRQLASDMAWVNSSALPPSVPARRFSSEQESFSMVDPPSHTSLSPVESRRDGAAEDTSRTNGNVKGGFTGALKRFFGMGSKPAEKKPPTPPKPAGALATVAVTAPENDVAVKDDSVVPDSTARDSSVLGESTLGGLERHTVLDSYGATREPPASQESFRYTMAGYGDSKEVNSRFEGALPSQAVGESQGYKQVLQQPERKRRGTFDDLFESPKNNVAAGGADRYSTTGANGWAARLGETSSTGQASYNAAAVGVSRFDERRSVDGADEFAIGEEKVVRPPVQSVDNSTEAWRRAAAMSLLDDRKDAPRSEGSGFTWSNVRSAPGVGTATYAVPTSLQPRAVFDEVRDAPGPEPARLGNIMDDLTRGSTSKKPQGKESVDDFFAEFEEPNDYVFDPATGGYVAARAPPRATAVARHVSRSESTDLLPPQTAQEKVIPMSSERDYNAPSRPISESTALTVATRSERSEDVGDEVAEIIVDKISSLESELAALKQLIRNQKGSGGTNQKQKPRGSHTAASRSVRKESIFDNDSSDEDDTKTKDPNTSSARAMSKRENKRRPGSKTKLIKKRKDSFADLFEDSPNENETLGGATSYEALFQTGANKDGARRDEESDEDAEQSPKATKTKTSKARRRSSRKINGSVPAKEDSDSEPDLTSLKARRSKRSSRRKTNEFTPDASTELTSRKSENQLATPASIDVIPAAKPVKSQVDPIDALFDSSADHDMTKLYGGAEEGGNSALESKPAASKAKSTQSSSTALTDDEVSGTPSLTTAKMKSEEPVSKPFSYSDDQDEADEDEFSINWSKMRKTKSRRHKARRPSSKDESIVAAESTTADLFVEPGLAGSSSGHSVEASDPAAENESSEPRALLADTASNWMSVTSLGEPVNLSFSGDTDLESLVLSESDDTEHADTTAEAATTNGDNKDELDTASTAASVNHSPPVEDITPSELVSAEASDETAEELPRPNPSSVEAIAKAPKAEVIGDESFDIFDKSGDMSFVSAASPMHLEMPSHDGADADAESDDNDSLPDDEEAFSFEIKAPRKRSSVLDVSANISLGVVEHPPTPTSPADDSVELGKYATPSAQSSSRTPSIDGSLDDPEDVSADDEPVLGKVESQAFDADWQQMQAKEKERKKRLQAKQRQAQRDKVLRKQGVSSKALAGGAATHSSSKSKSKSGKKKKKDKDDAAPSSHHKKSGSSRKHRHREKEAADQTVDGAAATASEPPRSLTEL